MRINYIFILNEIINQEVVDILKKKDNTELRLFYTPELTVVFEILQFEFSTFFCRKFKKLLLILQYILKIL